MNVGLSWRSLRRLLIVSLAKNSAIVSSRSCPEIRSPRKSHIISRCAVTSSRNTQRIHGSWLYTQHLRRAASPFLPQ
jgi:hypothetical protein